MVHKNEVMVHRLVKYPNYIQADLNTLVFLEYHHGSVQLIAQSIFIGLSLCIYPCIFSLIVAPGPHRLPGLYGSMHKSRSMKHILKLGMHGPGNKAMNLSTTA